MKHDSIRTTIRGNEWTFKTDMFLSSDILLYKLYIYICVCVYIYILQIMYIYVCTYIPILLMLLSQKFPSALSHKDTIMRPLRDGASVMQSGEELNVSMACLNH